MLFACPRKAKEVAVVARLKKFRPHEAMAAPGEGGRSRRAPMPSLKGKSGSSPPSLASPMRVSTISVCAFIFVSSQVV
jgi:hypothetical protein